MGNLIIKVVKTKNIKHKETELNRLANILKHVGKKKEKTLNLKKLNFNVPTSSALPVAYIIINRRLRFHTSPPRTHTIQSTKTSL